MSILSTAVEKQPRLAPGVPLLPPLPLWEGGATITFLASCSSTPVVPRAQGFLSSTSRCRVLRILSRLCLPSSRHNGSIPQPWCPPECPPVCVYACSPVSPNVMVCIWSCKTQTGNHSCTTASPGQSWAACCEGDRNSGLHCSICLCTMVHWQECRRKGITLSPIPAQVNLT